ACALGVDPETPVKGIIEVLESRIGEVKNPKRVDSASCKENLMDDDINLFNFPVPMIHSGQGGRYIGTWAFLVSEDPETGITNWGMYRVMVCSKDLMSGLILPTSGLGRAVAKNEKENKSTPFALVIGSDPLTAYISATPIATDEEEVKHAGGLREESVPITKCTTNDLFVPANSEIVIEGEILPETWLPEGPFGEFTGYRVAPRDFRRALKVNSIMYRDNPILTVSSLGVPVDDTDIVQASSFSIILKEELKSKGIPITDVHMPPELASTTIVVGVEDLYGNIAFQIGYIVSSHPAFANYGCHVIVVESDVNVFDLDEVFHALATRCHPERGITAIKTPTSTLIPYLNRREKEWGYGVKTIFDCTWPREWSKVEKPVYVSFSNNEIYPEGIQEKVIENWEDYGYEKT
ncbi:hypothetical protein AKJ57_06200, partial [candidate division MSBL1 archaeon SCGC-AAA259A05]